jgi:hypothetical protein
MQEGMRVARGLSLDQTKNRFGLGKRGCPGLVTLRNARSVTAGEETVRYNVTKTVPRALSTC